MTRLLGNVINAHSVHRNPARSVVDVLSIEPGRDNKGKKKENPGHCKHNSNSNFTICI